MARHMDEMLCVSINVEMLVCSVVLGYSYFISSDIVVFL